MTNEMKTLTINGRTYALVDEAARGRLEQLETAGRIINTASGAEISLHDAAGLPLQGLSVYGKTAQVDEALESPSNIAVVIREPNYSQDLLSSMEYAGAVGTYYASGVYDPHIIENVSFSGSESNSYVILFLAATINASGTASGKVFRLESLALKSEKETITYDFAGWEKEGVTLAVGDGKDAWRLLGTRANLSADIGSVNVITYDAGVRWKNNTDESAVAFKLDGIPDGNYTMDFSVGVNSKGAAANIYILPIEGLNEIKGIDKIAPDGLRGVPVDSFGNYTDKNGQQWVCDEADFGRGVLVRRCGYIESYNGEEITEAYISSTGALTAGVEVVYVLPNPIETPLDEEILAAYAALRTYKPVTDVICTKAWMELKYVADPKAYIDNKITELQNAILAGGANL